MTQPAPRRRLAAALISAASLAASATTLVATPAHAATPSNDDFANAMVVTGAPGTAAAFAISDGATSQPGETMPLEHVPQNTVWFSWTAPSSGPVLFSLKNSSYDTMESVYTVSGHVLVPQGFDDDYDGYSHNQSAVPVVATAGTTYYVQVGSYTLGTTGTVALTVDPITVGITGTVTSGGAAVAGACVDDTHNPGGYAVTNSAGQYVIAQAAGTDTTTASNCLGGANLTSTAAAPSATTIGSGVASSPTINGTPGGSVTGRVIDDHGVPVQGAYVYVWKSGASTEGYTDATGHYQLTGLPAGAYGVEAWDENQNLFDQQLSGTVTVSGTATTPAPDIQVTVGASLAGTVKGSTGSACGSASVHVMQGATLIVNRTTDSAGTYRVTVPVGSYTVSFTCSGSTLWFNQSSTQASGTTVTVSRGEALAGVDADFQHPSTAVPAPTQVAYTNGSPFTTPLCVADRAHVATSASAVTVANAANASAQATVAKASAAVKKLEKQIKKAKRSGRPTKRLTKRLKAAKKALAADQRAWVAATAAVNAANGSVASANAAVATAC